MKKFTDYLDLKDYYDFGWDGDPDTLDDLKKRLNKADKLGWDASQESFFDFEKRAEKYLEMGWKPSEEHIEWFEEDIEKAKKLGWDESLMSYKQFQKKLDMLVDKGWSQTKKNLQKLDALIEQYKSYGWNGRGDMLDFEVRMYAAEQDGWDPNAMTLPKFEKMWDELDSLNFDCKKISLANFLDLMKIAHDNGWDYTIRDFDNYCEEILEGLYLKTSNRSYVTNEDMSLINQYRKYGWNGKISTLPKITRILNFSRNNG